jgi:hypothetical protein
LYCEHCGQYKGDTVEQKIRHLETCCTPKRKNDSGDFLVSAAIGAITDSAVVGGLVGGNLLGGIVGDALFGDDDFL